MVDDGPWLYYKLTNEPKRELKIDGSHDLAVFFCHHFI